MLGAAGAVVTRAKAAAPIELVGTPATHTSGGQATTHTLAYAVASSGANRKLIVAAATEVAGGTTHTGVTYNGTAMTNAGNVSTFSNDRISLWFMDDADLPTDGLSHDIVLTTGDSTNALMAAVEYKNVAQGAPSGTGGDSDTSGGPLSTTLNGVSEGALVVDTAVYANNETSTPGGSQTERYDFGGTANAFALVGSDQIGVSAGNITMTQQIDLGAPDTEQLAAWWGRA